MKPTSQNLFYVFHIVIFLVFVIFSIFIDMHDPRNLYDCVTGTPCGPGPQVPWYYLTTNMTVVLLGVTSLVQGFWLIKNKFTSKLFWGLFVLNILSALLFSLPNALNFIR